MRWKLRSRIIEVARIGRRYVNCSRCRGAQALIFVLVLALPGSSGWAQPGAPLVVVGTAERAAVIDEVPLSGTVTSPRVAKLSSEVSGLVKTVRVDAGDRVQAGDVLLNLDSELEQLSLEAARAATEQARQQLADVKRRLADAQVLARQKTISANELQSLEAEMHIDNAAVQRLVAEQQRLEARLRRYQLLAPFAGVISRKHIEAGEWVQPGDAVLELVASDGLRIDFQVPQAVFPKVSAETEVQVRLDSLSGQAFAGRIHSMVPVSDPGTRTFLLRVVLGQGGVAMMPGMSASGVLRLQTGRKEVVVARDALMRYPDGRVTVWVVSDDQGTPTVSEHRVTTGLSFNGRVAIVAGLEDGARVVLQGNEALKEGQAVAIRRQE